METLKGYDNWKSNAPESPAHGECAVCHITKDFGDMTNCGPKGCQVEVCHDCIDEITGPLPAPAERIVKRYGVFTANEIKEYLEN